MLRMKRHAALAQFTNQTLRYDRSLQVVVWRIPHLQRRLAGPYGVYSGSQPLSCMLEVIFLASSPCTTVCSHALGQDCWQRLSHTITNHPFRAPSLAPRATGQDCGQRHERVLQRDDGEHGSGPGGPQPHGLARSPRRHAEHPHHSPAHPKDRYAWLGSFCPRVSLRAPPSLLHVWYGFSAMCPPVSLFAHLLCTVLNARVGRMMGTV